MSGRSGSLRVAALAWLVLATACASAFLNEEHDVWLEEVGFAQRRGWPSAVLHRERTEFTGTARISQILDRVPGVLLVRPDGEHWGLLRAREEGGPCVLSVYVNGSEVLPKRLGGQWTVDFLSEPRELLGLELHFGAEGPVYDEVGCGTLLLWTRVENVVPDGPLRGDIQGRFWGDGAEAVTDVTLEPGAHAGSWGPDGSFSFLDLLPGRYEVVVHNAQGVAARSPVRVYAYAEARMEVVLRGAPAPPPPPSSWPGCYAFRALEWSRPLEAWAAPLHAPPDTFRLHEEVGDDPQSFEHGRPLARPRLAQPEWGGRPAAHWQDRGADSAWVVWTNGFNGAALTMVDTGGDLEGTVRWINDAVSPRPDPDGTATLERVICPPTLPDDPFGEARGPSGAGRVGHP